MQNIIFNTREKTNGLRSLLMRDEWAAPDESLAAFSPEIENLDEARRALGKAARLIRAQEDRIRQLENMAVTDELTGLFNRRGLLVTLQRELAAAQRDEKASGVLVMIDLDGFKAINDQWGKAAGDEYLRAVAYALTSAVRASDYVCRLGGDEFAILLTQVDADTGRDRVAALEYAFNNRLAGWNCETAPLRGSFGFAVYSAADTPEAILAAADLKLYAHKANKAARDRVS